MLVTIMVYTFIMLMGLMIGRIIGWMIHKIITWKLNKLKYYEVEIDE